MPYWRLSSFYFFYFAALGALVPFWGLYLQDRGFSALEIGQLMAVIMGTKIIAPNLWGWIADATGRPVLAGPVEAREHDDHRVTGMLQGKLDLEQLLAQRQRLAFGVEAGHYPSGIHALLDDLQGDPGARRDGAPRLLPLSDRASLPPL